MKGRSGFPIAMVQPSLLERALIIFARQFPIQRGKLRVVSALWRLANGARSPFRTSRLIFGELLIECDLRDMLQRQYHFFGTYFLEAGLIDRWQEQARSARVILDVGANSGIYSLAAAVAAPTSTIYAFEPSPGIAARLRRNLEINRLQNIVVCEAAAGSADGIGRLVGFSGEANDNDGQSYLAGTRVPDGSDTVEVTVRSLDNFAAEHDIKVIDLLKLDVQGHEPMVLEGASSLLSAGAIHTIFIELNWNNDCGPRCPADISVACLADANYLFAELPAGSKWQEAGPWLRAHTDVVAAHRSYLAITSDI